MEAKIPLEYDYIKYTMSAEFLICLFFFFFFANIGKEGLQFDTVGFLPSEASDEKSSVPCKFCKERAYF